MNKTILFFGKVVNGVPMVKGYNRLDDTTGEWFPLTKLCEGVDDGDKGNQADKVLQ